MTVFWRGIGVCLVGFSQVFILRWQEGERDVVATVQLVSFLEDGDDDAIFQFTGKIFMTSSFQILTIRQCRGSTRHSPLHTNTVVFWEKFSVLLVKYLFIKHIIKENIETQYLLCCSVSRVFQILRRTQIASSWSITFRKTLTLYTTWLHKRENNIRYNSVVLLCL